MSAVRGIPRVPDPELSPLTGEYIDHITDVYRIGDPAMVLYAAGHLAAAVTHYLNPRDGDEAYEALMVNAIEHAAQQIERARQLLGHYPLCDTLTSGDAEDCGCLR